MRKGDEEAVLAEYRTGSGRSRIAKLVLAQKIVYVVGEFPNYTGLMGYWRDESAHGLSTPIYDEQAFTSLLLLLRFAHFADECWAELTKPLAQTSNSGC